MSVGSKKGPQLVGGIKRRARRQTLAQLGVEIAKQKPVGKVSVRPGTRNESQEEPRLWS